MVCVCVSWRHGINLCAWSDCQRECSWCLIWTKTRLYSGYTGVCVCVYVCACICVCVFSLIPPHTLDRHCMLTLHSLFSVSTGSYYGSRMNSSLSTSSDLLSPLFLLSLSPWVSSFSFIPLLLFSSLSFIIYAALFSPCSPHFLISFLGFNHALLTGVLFINECLPLATYWTVLCHCVFPIDSN